MNYFYLLYRFFFLFLCLFLPDISSILYCYIKRNLYNTYKCTYWACKKYNTCYYNQKTLLDFKHSHKYHDFLWYFVSFSFAVILVFIFFILEVLLWQ